MKASRELATVTHSVNVVGAAHAKLVKQTAHLFRRGHTDERERTDEREVQRDPQRRQRIGVGEGWAMDRPWSVGGRGLAGEGLGGGDTRR